MELKRIIRATVLSILACLTLLSSTTIWANSLAFETCILSGGKCVSNGCTGNGGVCGMQEPELPQRGEAAAFDKCWCLF
jgi:hypothetical protein